MNTWVAAAIGSAFFAGVTSVLAKLGIRRTDSDVATAIRTLVVLAMAWAMALVRVPDVPAALAAISPRSYLFLVLSGLATGASWICYFSALSQGDVNKVVPIDKSSAVLATLMAIALFGETNNLPVRLGATAVILVGTILMVERRSQGEGNASRGSRWLALAVLSALFAALTSILAKVGIEGVDSGLATALRTCVVLVMAWSIVAARSKLPLVRRTDRGEFGYLVLSGLATGVSWLCYYYAVQTGQVGVVVQIDKLSILVSVLFARLAFGERLSCRSRVGLALLVAGTVAMTAWA